MIAGAAATPTEAITATIGAISAAAVAIPAVARAPATNALIVPEISPNSFSIGAATGAAAFAAVVGFPAAGAVAAALSLKSLLRKIFASFCNVPSS